MPSGRTGRRMTMSLPSLASSRPSLYIPFGSSEPVSTSTGPSVSDAISRTAFRYSVPAASAPEIETQAPSSSPKSLTRRASSALALSRKKRMEGGFYNQTASGNGRRRRREMGETGWRRSLCGRAGRLAPSVRREAMIETGPAVGLVLVLLVVFVVVAQEVFARLLSLALAGLRSRSGRQRGLRLLLALVGFGELGHADDAVALLELDDAHALGGAAGLADVLDLDANELASLRDQQELVGVRHRLDARHRAVLVGDLDVDHARSAAALEPVLLDLRALPVAVLGDRQQVRLLVDDVHLDDLVVVLLERDADDAGRVAAHGADVLLREPDAHALPRADEDLVLAARDAHREQGVPLLQVDRDDAAR